ncbi:MAG: class I tRNA ligase family protein, partial [Candidatus Saccharimonadales bacterium]|nr:class I tRNA ligase family protein [Candidatus Saccharimonadales bacterium]
LSVIGFDGKITHHAPAKYRGMDVNQARQAVVDDLQTGGFLQKTEEYTNSVGHCYKCHTVIEPLLKDQWFVRMQPLAKRAIQAIEKDQIKFYPANKKDHAILYLQNVRDWNISRQIAWGIPIPAFRHADNPDEWIFSEQVDQEVIEQDGHKYVRDPDVFDTWFSSGQWPFVTLGYPDDPDYKKFYPTSVMETGGEIFNQWVLRMIMLGLYVTDQVPFTTVYIHGYVLSEDGTKMSKSLDNVINPMDEIAQYGSDALRMGLISGRTAGTASAYSQEKIIGGRNFANKLWNIARFTEGVLGDEFTASKPVAKQAVDDWMLRQLNQGIHDITSHLENYRFNDAYEALYKLIWSDFADWYVEASKSHLNENVLAHCLKTILILAHPFAPFVTETIWQTLTWTDGLVMTADWPAQVSADDKLAEEFEEIMAIITEIRELKTRLHLRQNTLYHKSSHFISENADLIIKLSGVFDVSQVDSGQGLHLTQTKADTWLDIDHTTIREYLNGLNNQFQILQSQLESLQKRLANKSYLSKAPKQLIQESKQQLKDVEQSIGTIQQQIQAAESSLSLK